MTKANGIELAKLVTPNFNSGDFMMPLVLNYFGKAVEGGTPLQVVVKLQSRNGNSFVDVSSTSTILNASDKTCQNKCSATISTTDAAPANGVITVRSHYGSFFRPEGWLHSAMPVKAGQRAFFSVVGSTLQLDRARVVLPCDRQRSHAQDAARAVLAQ